MKTSRRGAALRKLLDLCDDLQRMRTRMSDPAMRRDTRTRLRQQVRTKTQQLADDLAAYRFRGPLGHILRESKLESMHFLVLAILLQRHLRADTVALAGREILGAVFDSSFAVLHGIDLLHENGELRASGLIVVDDEDEDEFSEDVLETRFKISAEALIAFREEISGVAAEDQKHDRRVGGYANNREYLIDLRILHNLHRHRSEKVFQIERWDRVRLGTIDPGRQISRRIDRFWNKIQQRIELSENAATFPGVRFVREHGLQRAEVVMIMHLLFKELYEGNAYADAAELVRLVSADENELIRNRALVLSTGQLQRREILQIESMIEGRDLTGEVHLSDWVVNYVFGAEPACEEIQADERLDWHLYLEKIDDTGSFFKDLESN